MAKIRSGAYLPPCIFFLGKKQNGYYVLFLSFFCFDKIEKKFKTYSPVFKNLRLNYYYIILHLTQGIEVFCPREPKLNSTLVPNKMTSVLLFCSINFLTKFKINASEIHWIR